MDITRAKFKRQFALSMYKNLKIPLGRMTFDKDFVTETQRGDLYPLVNCSADCLEMVRENRYTVSRGSADRMIGRFFPYASYEVRFRANGGNCGFSFHTPTTKATVLYAGDEIRFSCAEQTECAVQKAFGDTLIVSCRPGAFDVYCKKNDRPVLVHTFRSQDFAHSHSEDVFTGSFVCLAAQGGVSVEYAAFYIDNGISLADIRPIRYENGQVMLQEGKLYFTASIRMQEEMFQGVFSWVPGTADIALTGALFYDAGDGLWCGDVAASVLYDRRAQQWYVWVCSFNHGHVLAHAAFEGDPRFGVNVIDVQLMPKAPENDDIRMFAGFSGDEDPDFYYDAQREKWMMAICRLDRESRKYRYVFFESDAPFDNYVCIGMGLPGEETGGSFVKIDGKLHFVCGNAFAKKSDYRIYRSDGMHSASFDFPDGGFRGWGTVIPVVQCSRTRYYWLTFDRHNGSDYNWSYGNFYCFEATERE